MVVRIGFVIDTIESPTAGTERQLLFLLSRLDRSRFSPYLYVLRDSKWLRTRFDLAPLRIAEVDSFRTPAGWRGVGRLASMLRSDAVQVLHVHFRDGSIAGIAAAKLAGTPWVVAARRNQGYWMNGRERVVQRLLNRGVDMFVANSRDTGRQVAKVEGVGSDRIRVVNNGLDPEAFAPRAETARREARRRLGLPEDAPVAGIVANLRPVKRIDVFLHAAAHTVLRLPEARFVVVGEGDQRPRLEALRAKLGLEDAVRFLGRREDVAAILPAFDVGVLSSDSESFSNALAEYMACGLAVAATRVGGCAEAFEGGAVGVVVEPGDGPGLGRAMAGLLADPEGLSRAAGVNPELARQRFSPERFVQGHSDVYRELAERA